MKQVETDRWYGHNALPAHCTRQYIRGWEEEGPCDNCGEPMLSGDRCYYNSSTEQYYCCLACLKESHGSWKEELERDFKVYINSCNPEK